MIFDKFFVFQSIFDPFIINLKILPFIGYKEIYLYFIKIYRSLNTKKKLSTKKFKETYKSRRRIHKVESSVLWNGRSRFTGALNTEPPVTTSHLTLTRSRKCTRDLHPAKVLRSRFAYRCH